MTTSNPIPTKQDQTLEGCPECKGESVQFKGKGRDLQYRICPRFEEAGHLSREAIAEKIRAEQVAGHSSAFRSGRWA